MGKSIRELGVIDFVNAGLPVAEAIEFDAVLREILSLCVSSTDIWRQIVTERVLKPSQPHSLHQLVYYSLYHSSSHASDDADPPLYWFPSLEQARDTNLGRLLETYGPKLLGASYTNPITSFRLFYKFSVEHPQASSNTKRFLASFRSIGPLFLKNSQFHSLKLQDAFWILLIPQSLEELGFPALS
ncbi:hypothetical protein PIB30_029114 [Stylosanthes scabra]|uniref:Uncharacterized protein n=1 Tax=Stylosanthes scabra TaxID=79078 RepID=A0ABU6UD70_9FABA|nr:hypothetical protein [Stylosanthes scabra]